MRIPRVETLWSLLVALAILLAAAAVPAQVPVDAPGQVESLDAASDPHWIWVSDVLMQRRALVDLDDGRFLGLISTGYSALIGVQASKTPEIYVPETYYSRGSRGERTDVVTIYDAQSLLATAEVTIPPKRAHNILPSANTALTDDDRFLAVFNLTPATSISIVDMQTRSFTVEIQTPGCSLVYPAGPRRLLMLCGDGTLLVVKLSDAGQLASKHQTEPFFDPRSDPVTEKAVRARDAWVFVSFEGMLHRVDVSGDEIAFDEPWSLVSDAERKQSWRIGGSQHLALHRASGQLYSLMHQGGADTHKQPGTELWVYDLAKRERVRRIELAHPGFSLMGQDIEVGQDWVWPFNGLWDWMLGSVLPNPGLLHVQVTQDDEPLLVTSSMIGSSMAVYDARSLELLRRVSAGNLTVSSLQLGWLRSDGGQ